jgi:hypothetical protein
MFPLRKIRFWWLMLAACLIPGSLWAADFSALMLVKDGGRVVPGKIYVHDGKMRQEFSDEEGQTITIVRPDKKVVWVIIPRDRAYMELPLRYNKLPGQFIQVPPNAFGKRPAGKDRLNGYDTEKFQLSVPGGTGLEKQTIWVAQKLGPIKLECPERQFCLEYKSIKEGAVADRLFELPPGYQKMASSRGFADKINN